MKILIIGAGVASGDLLGNSTIDLVPDIDLYNNHQYLVIDPTTINHIHVRAGGTPDDSYATLILGGEKSNVTISDQSTNHVIINSKTEDETTSNVWIFNAEGDLILPISGDIKDSDGNSVLGGVGSGYSETVTIQTVSGTGPYTVTLSGMAGLDKYTYACSYDNTLSLTLPNDMTKPMEIIISDMAGTASTYPISILANSGQSVKGGGGGPAIIIDTDFGTVSLKWIPAASSWIILYGR